MSEIKIDADFAIPDEPPKARTRGRKSKLDNPLPATGLINALKFISPAQKKTGTVQQTYCMIRGHWIAASNGILTIGAQIQEDLEACPQSQQFLTALTKCGEELVITQLSSEALSVKSDKFRGLIQCVEFADVVINAPDPICAVIDDRIKAAFAATVPICIDGDAKAFKAGVYLQQGSAIACDGCVLIEYWHGNNLPPGKIVPRAAAVAVAKAKAKLSGFGLSESSYTFWFEDGSFIKTQLYNDPYPNYKAIFDSLPPINFWQLPEEFFVAVKTLSTFSKDNIIFFNNEYVLTDTEQTQASLYRLKGLPDGFAFDLTYLLALKESIKMVDFISNAHAKVMQMVFEGENVRGTIAAINISSLVQAQKIKENMQYAKNNQQAAPIPNPSPNQINWNDFEDDIPF